MKAVFLAVLLANVFFFAWSRWHAPAAQEDYAAASSPPPTLMLADEVNGEVPSGNAAPRTESPDRIAGCRSIGPFPDLPQASRAATTLRESGHEPRTRAAEGEIWAGLWVYLEGLPSRAEAQRIMALLKQNGMTDAYIMPSLTGSNEISLGIFSEPPRAQRRAEDARRLGLKPTTVDHTRKGTVYWLDMDLKPGDSPLDPADLQGLDGESGGRIVRLQVQACPAP